MERKKTRDEILGTKPRLIGVAGIGHSVGCTHFSIMLVNYLAGFLRRKASLLEWNSSGALDRIEKVCTGVVSGRKPYHVLDADYYKCAGSEEMKEALSRKYEDILIDFGNLEDGRYGEFLRCEKQFLVASFSEWQQDCFREFVMKNDQGKNRSWQYLAVFGSEETRKEFMRRFGVFTERIPFSADAFSVTKECGIFFRELFPEL